MYGESVNAFERISDSEADRLFPVPPGYMEASAPLPSPGSPPRSPEALADLKRETVKTVKQIGLIQGGKPVEFAWASAAITTLARTIGIEGYAIESASDETTVIKVHNEAVLQLRKLRDDH